MTERVSRIVALCNVALHQKHLLLHLADDSEIEDVNKTLDFIRGLREPAPETKT